MMLRTAFVLTLLLAPLATGCAAEANTGARSRDAQNPIPTEGVGANGGVAATPRDMPGNGRGSLPTSHGR